MAWNTLTDLQYGSLVTEGDMDDIRGNIEHLGALLTGADVALSSKAAGANIGAAMATGSYTGNGISGHAITGVGFQPRRVYVFGHSSWSILTAQDIGGTIRELYQQATSTGTYFVSFDSDGFTVTASQATNNSGTTYYFVAWE